MKVNEACARTVDGFYHISYAALIDSCTAHNYNLKAEMNSRISSYYSLPAMDYVDYIFKRFWVGGRKQTAFACRNALEPF